jgi:hypothetical protein
MVTDIDAWFGELDRFTDVLFKEGGRHQPRMPQARRPCGDERSGVSKLRK